MKHLMNAAVREELADGWKANADRCKAAWNDARDNDDYEMADFYYDQLLEYRRLERMYRPLQSFIH